jgi:hypothetical protein
MELPADELPSKFTRAAELTVNESGFDELLTMPLAPSVNEEFELTARLYAGAPLLKASVPIVTAVLMLTPVPVAAPNVAVAVAPDAGAPPPQFDPVSHAPLLDADQVALPARTALAGAAISASSALARQTLIKDRPAFRRFACFISIFSES